MSQSSNRNKFFEADYALQLNDYETALKLFKQLQKRDPDNALYNYRVGQCLLNLPDSKKEALPYLEVAVKSVSADFKEGNYSETNAPTETYFLLAKAYHLNEELDNAIYYYNTYLPYTNDNSRKIYVNNQIKACELAKISIENPVPVKTEVLGAPINSDMPEIYPVISDDESVLIYLEQRENTNIMYYTVKEGEKWAKPININSYIGSIGDSYPSSISSDKTRLYITVKDFFTSTICYSVLTNGRWTKMKKLKKPVNSKSWNSQAFESSGGDELFFVSDRKGGYGGLDIYKSVKNSKGKWDNPENLGSNINTDLNEIMPIISSDGKRFYFCSEGHTSIGGYDIFMSVRTDVNSWSAPVNLGYPINTTDDDVYFRPIKDGILAYSSLPLSGDIGNYDIARLEIFSDQIPEKALAEEPLGIEGKEEEIALTVDQVKPVSNDQAEAVSKAAMHDAGNDEYDITYNQTDNISESTTEAAIIKEPDKSKDLELTPAVRQYYTVQIMALKNPVRADYFKNIDGLTIQVGYDGFYRYITGKFNSINEAKSDMIKLKSLGYKNAFIRKYNLDQYLSGNNIIPLRSSYDHESRLNETGYTIQIMEKRDPVPVSYFKDLDNLKVSYGTDKIFRYTYKGL
jgi:tetratricopeptide (TPR) repeat protein